MPILHILVACSVSGFVILLLHTRSLEPKKAADICEVWTSRGTIVGLTCFLVGGGLSELFTIRSFGPSTPVSSPEAILMYFGLILTMAVPGFLVAMMLWAEQGRQSDRRTKAAPIDSEKSRLS